MRDGQLRLVKFAAERQRVLELRRAGAPPPWTRDPVIRDHKFTNVFRADDRVSQHLLREVVCHGKPLLRLSDEDCVFRVVLYDFFKRPSTWEALRLAVGEPRLSTDHEELAAALDAVRGARYTSAYLMVVAPREGEATNWRNHLRLARRIAADGLVLDALLESVEACHRALTRYDSVGNFVATQLALDLNYLALSPHGEGWVSAGPGARDGLAKVGGRLAAAPPLEAMREVAARADEWCDRAGVPRIRLAGQRPLQVVDAEHLLCEFSKYARARYPGTADPSGRTAIKAGYDAAAARPLPLPVYPPKWGIL